MDEITAANQVFPAKITESYYESGILTLRAEKGVLISVRCPFHLLQGENVEIFPKSELDYLPELSGVNIRSISMWKTHQYPDLIIQLDNYIEIRACPTSVGEEMWFVDIPGVAFISP